MQKHSREGVLGMRLSHALHRFNSYSKGVEK